MHKSALSLVLFALLFAGCTVQVTTFPPGPITPTFSAVDMLATQVSLLSTPTPPALPQPTTSSTMETNGLLYFWPALIPPEMKFDSARSSYRDDGYIIEFVNSLGIDLILRAGTEADRYPYCEGQISPYQIRGVEGCSSMGTGAGASLEWKENGVHYSIGGIGNSLEAVTQFAGNLAVLDLQSWQQKFREATGTSSTSTHIEFASGTTSNTSAYQELAAGESDEYLLRALAGQEIAVSVTPYTFSDSPNFVLNISGSDGSVLVSETAQMNFWAGTLPVAQEYVIRVANHGNTNQYQLKVSAPLRIQFAAGATSTTLEGKLAAGAENNVYSLQAQPGQTMTVTASSANNSTCLTIAARMRDGSSMPLINSASAPTTSWSGVLPTSAEYSQAYSISVSSCSGKPETDLLYTLFVNVVN